MVAFLSAAFHLVPGDGNGELDVFVRDLVRETTQRVSLSHEGREADQASTEVALSGNGRFVAFASTAVNLVAGGTTGQQVFVRDLQERTTECVSVSTGGTPADDSAGTPSLSRDGRFVAFTSTATTLVSGTSPWLSRPYVRDRQERHTRLGGPVDLQAESTSMSADGRYLVATSAFGYVYVRDRFAPGLVAVSNGATSSTPVISADGRYVAFTTSQAMNASGELVNHDAYAVPNPL